MLISGIIGSLGASLKGGLHWAEFEGVALIRITNTISRIPRICRSED